MVNDFLKNKNKKIIKNVRGVTVPVALSRRPYPRPVPAGGRPQALVHRDFSTVVHICLCITQTVML